MEMKEIVFGGAMFSVFIIFVLFIISLCLLIKKWFIDDFNKGYEDAMNSD